MTSLLAAPPAVLGAQRPRVCWVPRTGVSSAGAEAVDLARMAGLDLDPWQQFVLEQALAERADGQWAAFEVGVEVARQNGKGSILEARELAGLFLLGEGLISHTAHQFDTALEAFERLLVLIESCPDFEQRVQRVSRSHGEEGIKLKGGQRIRFRTRTKGGGRGFSGDCVILDEAMEIPEASLGALFPTMTARENPQIWYVGSAVDQTINQHGQVFARIRERGHNGGDDRLAWLEWSADERALEKKPELADDPQAWAEANPGLGIRISTEYIAAERRALAARTFRTERLSVGDWPQVIDEDDAVIDLGVWASKADPESKIVGPAFFVFDVAPDQSSSAIGAAGRRADGRMLVEVVDRRRGTTWVPGRVVDLLAQHANLGIGCDASGPAAALLPDLRSRSVDVVTIGAKEHAQACGMFFAGVVQDDTVRHLGCGDLRDALRGAAKRPLGDAWAWSRKSSAVDISPLVACTLALWGLHEHTPRQTEPLVRRGGRRPTST